MRRIGQRIQELRVTPHAAYIFRRSHSSALDTQRMLEARLRVSMAIANAALPQIWLKQNDAVRRGI